MIRLVHPDDAADIVAIYNHYITQTTVTFEVVPLTVSEMLGRITHISQDYPFLVYEEGGKVQGYCYAHPWKEREAYRYTLETTIYLSPSCVGLGIGRQLMQKLIMKCHQLPCHALIACITAENTASCDFHTQLGFLPVSRFKEVGQKFGRWLDVVDYELLL